MGLKATARSRRHMVHQIATARMLLAAHMWYCFCFIPPVILYQFFPHVWSMYARWLKIWILNGYAANPVSTVEWVSRGPISTGQGKKMINLPRKKIADVSMFITVLI